MALVNPNGKPFTWSYSSINQFATCPAQYAAQRFYETTRQEDTEATLWGTRVHKALEERLRDKKPLDADLGMYEKWPRAIESKLHGKELHVERQFCVTAGGRLTDWFAEDAFGRGVVDVLLIDEGEGKAHIFDWKTGKPKTDHLQTKLFCYFVGLAYPGLELFNTKYIWLKHGTTSGEVIHRRQLKDIKQELDDKVGFIQLAWEHENFPHQPSGLCRGWCPVTECIHHKERR